MSIFTSDKFVAGQSIDMKDVLIATTPVTTPFTTLLLSKTVPAENVTLNWIEEAINTSSAVTLPEGGDAPAVLDDTLSPMSNYCELVGATAEVSNTAQASDARGISDLLAHQIDNRTKAIKLYCENILINGTKSYTSGTKTYTTSGILNQIHADNQVLTAGAFGVVKFEDTIAKLYNAGCSDEMICFLPASMKVDVNSFANITILQRDSMLGFDSETYITPYGRISFVLCEKLSDTLFIVNPNYLELAELIPFHGIPQSVSGSKQSVYLETQVGLKLLNAHAAASCQITSA